MDFRGILGIWFITGLSRALSEAYQLSFLCPRGVFFEDFGFPGAVKTAAVSFAGLASGDYSWDGRRIPPGWSFLGLILVFVSFPLNFFCGAYLAGYR